LASSIGELGITVKALSGEFRELTTTFEFLLSSLKSLEAWNSLLDEGTEGDLLVRRPGVTGKVLKIGFNDGRLELAYLFFVSV